MAMYAGNFFVNKYYVEILLEYTLFYTRIKYGIHVLAVLYQNDIIKHFTLHIFDKFTCIFSPVVKIPTRTL